MTWSQDYSPLPHWLFSTIVSALPVLTLFYATGSEEEGLDCRSGRDDYGGADREHRISYARKAHFGGEFAWFCFWVHADRLDHYCFYFSVSHRGGNGAVSDHEGIDRDA